MKFLTPAFVRVENPQERKELIKWLESIGNSYVISADNIFTHPEDFNWGACCGSNIPLFKALAAMNNVNDIEQCFVCELSIRPVFCGIDVPRVGDWMLSTGAKLKRIDKRGCCWRKATAEEIIEHFKNEE